MPGTQTPVDAVDEQVMALPPEAQCELARRILERLEDGQAGAVEEEAYWAEEIRRRLDEYDAGLVTEVRAAVDRVLAMPSAGSPYVAGTRRVIVRRFPYSVIYQPRSDAIIIVAIAHHRRAETYRLRRLRSPGSRSA